MKDKITVALSPEELVFLANAINETLEAVEEWEFQSRTGETRKRAKEIQAQLRNIIGDARKGHVNDL